MLFWQWGLCSVALPISSCFLGEFLPSFPECNLTSWSSEDSHPSGNKSRYSCCYFYWTRVRSFFTLVTNWLTDWLTDWLTNQLQFSKLDWCDPGLWRWQLKLVEVVSVVHVDDEKRVDNSLVQMWKVKFGHKVKFLFRLWAQGFKVWSRLWSWC